MNARQDIAPREVIRSFGRVLLIVSLAAVSSTFLACSKAKEKAVLTTYSYAAIPKGGARPLIGAYDFDVRGVVEGQGCVPRTGKITYLGFVGGVKFGSSREAQAVALAAAEALAVDKENDYLLLTRGLVQDEDWKICAQIYARGISLKKADELDR